MTILISHIPKTAGSSLKLLVEKFNPDTTWIYKGELSLINPNLEFLVNFRAVSAPPIVMGHYSYGIHRLLGVKPAYVTVLRNPIDRVVSLYRYQQSLIDSPFASYFREGLSLRDFVGNEITEMTNNHACRIIAGIPPDAGMTINDRWLLDLALHNLQRHYILLGRMEKIDSFLSCLGQLLNWPGIALPKTNVTDGEAIELDVATKNTIVEKNALDMALYDYLVANGDTIFTG